jgi:hypothetical protein
MEISNTFEKTDSSDIGRKLLQSEACLPLNKGFTQAIFIVEGKTPDEKQSLILVERNSEKKSTLDLTNLALILSNPGVQFSLRFKIIFETST